MHILRIKRLLHYQRHSLCGLQFHEKSEWSVTAPVMHCGHFITHYPVYTVSPYIHHDLVCNYRVHMKTKLTYLKSIIHSKQSLYVNDVQFYKKKLGQLHALFARCNALLITVDATKTSMLIVKLIRSTTAILDKLSKYAHAGSL